MNNQKTQGMKAKPGPQTKKAADTKRAAAYTPRILNGKGNLFVISGPSGAGKSALASAMCERMDGLTAVVTHTTRPIRQGEVDGIDYHFVSAEKFREIERDGGFVESATVYGERYGTGGDGARTRKRD